MKQMKIGISYPEFIEPFEDSFGEKIIDLTLHNDEMAKCDLIIFPGGEDISPSLYGRPATFSVGINPKRDNIESNIFTTAKRLNKKIFGVCRGHQLINVLLGGRLSQDIYFEEGIVHGGSHPLEFINGAKGPVIAYREKLVNSMHHQGVIKTGPFVTPTSFYKKSSISGSIIIESTESEQFMTVQFHPEFMTTPETKEFFDRIKNWTMHPLSQRARFSAKTPDYNRYYTVNFEGVPENIEQNRPEFGRWERVVEEIRGENNADVAADEFLEIAEELIWEENNEEQEE